MPPLPYRVANMGSIKEKVQQLKPTFWGRFFYYCIPYRKTVVLSNMKQAFGDELSDQEIKKLALSFYSHVAKCLKENVLMRFMTLNQIKSKARVEGLENIRDIILNNQSMLLLTGHFGNWEFAPIAGILNFEAYRDHFYFIRKEIKVEWLENILFHRFHRAGLKIISSKNALTEVSEAMDKKAAVVFVLDQHACIRAKDGVAVDFFKKKAGTYRSLAMLANYTNAPVVPVQTFRDSKGKHVLQFHPPLARISTNSNRQDQLENTLLYNRTLESMIIAHPEQWMWMHKRWKI